MTNDDDYLWGHYAALNEHLNEVIPILNEFCARHGFDYVDRRALGRYPRLRINRIERVELWYDLWMELNKDGNYFETFSRDIPYELSAGACFVVGDIRFQKAIACFSNKPFNQIDSVLLSEMERHLVLIEQWDAQYLQEYGLKVHLRFARE